MLVPQPARSPVLSALRAEAAAQRRHAARQRDRITADRHQRLVDAEVRDTRAALLRHARRHGGGTVAALFDPQLHALADTPTLIRAVLAAALTAADSCDLQLLDDGRLHIVAHHGFPRAFLDFFSTVDTATPSACGRVLATGRPVRVDDVTRSPVFTAAPTLQVLLDAGTRAVASYPLRTPDGTLLGVLSLHQHRPDQRHPARAHLIARGAAQALTHLPLRTPLLRHHAAPASRRPSPPSTPAV
ncbi:GAF domain-containing protein [Umezawaea beigongshangensis]|uniref:GAF domain-containing protein n=1 Tax=Umezawaea beigongshangensis TaxID=2780383 RepID=UPI0018F26D66|nr:GAF domain-containing protein [Umezawaea beigongshangensis]